MDDFLRERLVRGPLRRRRHRLQKTSGPAKPDLRQVHRTLHPEPQRDPEPVPEVNKSR